MLYDNHIQIFNNSKSTPPPFKEGVAPHLNKLKFPFILLVRKLLTAVYLHVTEQCILFSILS